MNDPQPQDREDFPAGSPPEAIVQMNRTLAGVLLAGLLVSAGWWGVQIVGQRSDSHSAALDKVRTGINPNSATWQELAQLPGLGESAGRAIVAFREKRMRATAPPVFRIAADLEPVPGIGPGTIERIAPHLRFDGIE